MNIAPALFTKLTTDAGVSALIGDRLYPEWTREADKVYPLAVYRIDTRQHLNNDGPTGLYFATIIIAAIGNSYADADAVGSALLSALDGTSGTWGTSYHVQGCFAADENAVEDEVVTDPDTEQILYYVQRVTFEASYTVS